MDDLVVARRAREGSPPESRVKHSASARTSFFHGRFLIISGSRFRAREASLSPRETEKARLSRVPRQRVFQFSKFFLSLSSFSGNKRVARHARRPDPTCLKLAGEVKHVSNFWRLFFHPGSREPGSFTLSVKVREKEKICGDCDDSAVPRQTSEARNARAKACEMTVQP